MGKDPKDHDFVVVGATPEDMLDAGFNQVGADFPVFLNSIGDEYALARQERKTGPGYHGFETTFDPSVTLEDDLCRRDLTINAMAREVIGWTEEGFAKLSDDIIDPFGGQEDLKNGVLRHVSEAFAEDPLRVLRVARFHARYKFKVHPDTLQLMKNLVKAGELNHLTPERVLAETEKAMMEKYPMQYFWTLQSCGAANVLFPEIDRTMVVTGYAFHKAVLRNMPLKHRWALLLVRTDVPVAEQLMTRLKMSNEVQKTVIAFRKLFTLIDKGTNNCWGATAEDILRVLDEIGVFRSREIIFDMAHAIVMITHGSRIDIVLKAFRDTEHISFASLTKEQQDTLVGADIGNAINDLRLQRVKAVM